MRRRRRDRGRIDVQDRGVRIKLEWPIPVSRNLGLSSWRGSEPDGTAAGCFAEDVMRMLERGAGDATPATPERIRILERGPPRGGRVSGVGGAHAEPYEGQQMPMG